MKLVLLVDGTRKTFVVPFISGRMLKKTIMLGTEIENDPSNPDNIDKMNRYVVDLYGNQFTEDQYLDGIAADDLIPTFTNCVQEVTGKLNSKLGALQDPNK